MTLDVFLDRIRNLRVDHAQGPRKPYKPLLLLAVLMLIDKGKIADGRVLLDGALKSVFYQLLDRIFPIWPFRKRVDVRLPFRHLESDGVWTLEPLDAAVEDFLAAKAAGAKARQLVQHVACARIDRELFDILRSSREARLRAMATLNEQMTGARELSTDITKVLAEEDASVVAPVPPNAELRERVIEELIYQRWSSTPFARQGVVLADPQKHGFVGRQQLTPVNAIDLLGYQAEAREWWVFELKKGRPADAVVGQISRYLGWFREERRARGETARGVVLAQGSDEKLRYAIAANERLSLWTYDAELSFSKVA